MTVRFYWGKTQRVHLSMPALDRAWGMSLYGFSVSDAFIGIMVRGPRVSA